MSKPVNIADQRVFHITHVRNLEAILASGALDATASPLVDVSSELARELRATVEVSPGVSVAEFVPFYLAADANLWLELRRGAVEPRWSAAARAAASADFVLLVSTVAALGDSAVICDGDAAGMYTRFAVSPDSADGMLRRLHATEQQRDAEALVRGSVPFDAVTLIGVANDPLRDSVREILAAAGRATKVAVYPPWFLAAD
jgi:hypothetical protein